MIHVIRKIFWSYDQKNSGGLYEAMRIIGWLIFWFVIIIGVVCIFLSQRNRIELSAEDYDKLTAKFQNCAELKPLVISALKDDKISYTERDQLYSACDEYQQQQSKANLINQIK